MYAERDTIQYGRERTRIYEKDSEISRQKERINLKREIWKRACYVGPGRETCRRAKEAYEEAEDRLQQLYAERSAISCNR